MLLRQILLMLLEQILALHCRMLKWMRRVLKDIKAFYMYQNDDGQTVRGVDLLVPGSGELMGGSERETRLDVLTGRMDELHISKEQMDWYVNLRRFGGCTHSGFGMGFERLIMYLTDIENIRDVIPYPRTPGNCEF